MNLSALPEGCLSHILSLTSLVDVIRSSAVSKQFLSASDSDTVWEKFLPSDYLDIISKSSSSSSSPLEYRSKKELFFQSPVLFDDGNKSFALDKRSGKKCYMLGARSLQIVWGDTPAYWNWTSMPESRFLEVAKLKTVFLLEIKGTLHTRMLTQRTTYGVYFVFKLEGDHYGFDNRPMKVSISETDDSGMFMENHHSKLSKTLYLKKCREQPNTPVKRDDEWMEIEMGRYTVDINGTNEGKILAITLREVEILNWKGGLVLCGIELRPLN